MSTKIKLQRLGKMREPHYRIVIADARTKRDGRVIETIGQYHPKDDPSTIVIDGERAAYWLKVGAQPTEAVTALLKVTGDWQVFKGLPAPPPMLVAAPKADRRALFAAAAAESAGLEDRPAVTARKRPAPREEAPAAGAPPAGTPEAAPPTPPEAAPPTAPESVPPTTPTSSDPPAAAPPVEA